MNKSLAKDNMSGIMEVYSPKRVNGMAEILGLLPGMSLDLSELDDDGKAWDFKLKKRETKLKPLLEAKERYSSLAARCVRHLVNCKA